MLPIVGALLGQGLNLLANAALAKGKEYVEEKTGIKLDDAAAGKPIDDDTAAKLKIAEMEHEEELLKLRLEDNKLDAALAEMYLKDTQDARGMQVKIATSDAAPMINKIINPVLSLIVIVGGLVILQVNPDAEVKYAIVTIMMLVLGYHFGTSQGSTKANQMFRDIIRKNGSSH